MSAAAATPVGAAVPRKKGKKKLIVIVLIALVVVLGAGAGGLIYMKKKAAAEAQAESEDGAPVKAHASAKAELKHPPTFLPLDSFVVNLADKDSDRYAQIGITLEVMDAKFAEQMKAYMPALRNIGFYFMLVFVLLVSALQVQGTVRATFTFSASTDARLKTDISASMVLQKWWRKTSTLMACCT